MAVASVASRIQLFGDIGTLLLKKIEIEDQIAKEGLNDKTGVPSP
jgi:hypothetical protein